MRRAMGLGLALALDDFGSGPASLSSLKKFDIDYLKLDPDLVQQLEALMVAQPVT